MSGILVLGTGLFIGFVPIGFEKARIWWHRMEHRSASPTLAFSVIRKTSGRRTKSTGKKTDRTHHNSYQRFALQFGTRNLSFCMVFATFGHGHFLFCMVFATFGHVCLPFCMVFTTFWYFNRSFDSICYILLLQTQTFMWVSSVLSFRASFRVFFRASFGALFGFFV